MPQYQIHPEINGDTRILPVAQEEEPEDVEISIQSEEPDIAAKPVADMVTEDISIGKPIETEEEAEQPQETSRTPPASFSQLLSGGENYFATRLTLNTSIILDGTILPTTDVQEKTVNVLGYNVWNPFLKSRSKTSELDPAGEGLLRAFMRHYNGEMESLRQTQFVLLSDDKDAILDTVSSLLPAALEKSLWGLYTHGTQQQDEEMNYDDFKKLTGLDVDSSIVTYTDEIDTTNIQVNVHVPCTSLFVAANPSDFLTRIHKFMGVMSSKVSPISYGIIMNTHQLGEEKKMSVFQHCLGNMDYLNHTDLRRIFQPEGTDEEDFSQDMQYRYPYLTVDGGNSEEAYITRSLRSGDALFLQTWKK